MKRRSFIGLSLFSGLGIPFYSFANPIQSKSKPKVLDVFSITRNKVRIFTNCEIKSTLIYHITDTHLAFSDKRETPFQAYSSRMGNAYKLNKHFETNVEISCAEGFEQTLEKAKEQKADFLALTGDIFSFPSEAAIDWAYGKLKETNIPFGYIAGNHDWHYEGMPGSSYQLRKTWASERLKSLFQGNNYLFASYDINGVRMIFIDNSTYEIEPEQLEFYTGQSSCSLPVILFMHIPLYFPGRSMGYGCANPNWGEHTDKSFELEKREKWRKGGHTKTTYRFHDEVFKTPNLIAVFAGHTHLPAIDVKNNIPQIVSGHNATGNYTEIYLSKTE